MVNWSFLLLWPSQRTLYISTRLVAQEIRQSWSHFIAARRRLPPKKDWCCIPYQYWVGSLKDDNNSKFTEHWKFALFVLILSANWSDAHWTLFAPAHFIYTSHCTMHTSHEKLYNTHSTLHNTQNTLHTLHCILRNAHSTLQVTAPPYCWIWSFVWAEIAGGLCWLLFYLHLRGACKHE